MSLPITEASLTLAPKESIFLATLPAPPIRESLPVLFNLIEKEGLSLGTSCGVNIAGAIRLGKLLGPGKTIVTILCDKSDKYNSKMFNKSFLQEKGLPYPHWI